MPPEDKQTEAAALHPVAVTVIGTGRAVGGPTPLETGTLAKTPEPHQPNLIVRVIPPLMAIAIRFGHSYLAMLVGLVLAGLANNGAIPSSDFASLVWTCAGLSVAGPGLGLLKDLVTIFARLEGKYPLLTGNV